MLSINQNKKNIIFLLVSLILILLPGLVFADAAAPVSTNFVDLLNKIINLLTGKIGTTLAILAVVFLGIMAMFGMWDGRRAFFVILGIVIVFSAAWIVGEIAPKTTTSVLVIENGYV